jgi:uncharacterized LabA/DUF88 family protein/cold shock CspA family protein
MIKAMVFIDGSWLYANLGELARTYDQPDFQIDFGRLPQVLADDVAEQAGLGRIDLVRTVFFASYAESCDPRDLPLVHRRQAFFTRLREDYSYDLETFGINYHGRRLRRGDRDADDPFQPREKCVDLALAVRMTAYAMTPGAMDVAIAVIGDRDFVPVLREVRRSGRRVALASIFRSCADELADPADAAGVRDFDVIWLEDILNRIELRSERQQLICQSPSHQGDRRVWTSFVPRRGRRFICDRCRAQAREQLSGTVEVEPGGSTLRGRIKNLIWDRGYGFIAAEDGQDYFFHANALDGGLVFEELESERPVQLEVKTAPAAGRAGAARLVRPDDPGAAGADDGIESAAGGDPDDAPAAPEIEREPACEPASGGR